MQKSGGTQFKASLGKKFARKCKYEDCSPGWPGYNARLYRKITKAKKAEGMAQVVEYLPSKHKNLSSTPS
jgi:hypothetical protein